jgi:hypothetical protein
LLLELLMSMRVQCLKRYIKIARLAVQERSSFWDLCRRTDGRFPSCYPWIPPLCSLIDTGQDEWAPVHRSLASAICRPLIMNTICTSFFPKILLIRARNSWLMYFVAIRGLCNDCAGFEDDEAVLCESFLLHILTTYLLAGNDTYKLYRITVIHCL